MICIHTSLYDYLGVVQVVYYLADSVCRNVFHARVAPATLFGLKEAYDKSVRLRESLLASNLNSGPRIVIQSYRYLSGFSPMATNDCLTIASFDRSQNAMDKFPVEIDNRHILE